MKHVVAAAALLATLATGSASAAPVRQTIDVSVTVPAAAFYVKPQTGWPTAPVQLLFDPVDKTFNKYVLPLQIFNSVDDVEASMAFVPVLTEESSNKTLSLSVSIGGTALTVAPAVIHTKAAAEKVYPLEITSTVAAPAAGNYLGSVSLVFDAKATVKP